MIFRPTESVHAACRRTIFERIAVRAAAVPAGGGSDAGVRHHGFWQSGAWLALYDGRLFRRDLCDVDGEFCLWRYPSARRNAAARHRAGIRGVAALLRPRSSRSCAGALRIDPILQRRGAADLGPGGPGAAAAGLADGADPDHARRVLSELSIGDHRGLAPGRSLSLCGGDAHAPRHADPRRRLQPRNDRRARHQHKTALHAGVWPWRSTRRPRRADAGADFDGADRDGREHPDPRLRHHRDWRHRLDPRRLPGRDLRRADRYAWPRLPARFAAEDPELRRRFHRSPRTLLDADLHADGDRARGAAGGGGPCPRAMKDQSSGEHSDALLVLAGLLLLPLYTSTSGNVFALTLFTRIVIFALAASSLNLIMGYGGMMSFGHAAYLGIGGYAVGILAAEGIGSGFVQWPVALLSSAVFALVVGALCLRTRGVYFIMITLAFAQMIYYVAVGLYRYGGDDGLSISRRSQFGDVINLASKVQFYYLCLAVLLAAIFLTWRLTNSRFGMVIRGTRSNDRR